MKQMLADTKEKLQFWLEYDAPKWLKTVWSYIGLDDLIAVILLLLGILGYVRGPIPYIPGWHEFYSDIKSELVGLGITVLILGNADQYIRTQMEKRRLILQMGSPDNAFAVEAARQLKARDWLYDGTISRVRLENANLSGVDLRSADLIMADFRHADLSGADLKYADLSEALLRNADLSGAYLTSTDLSGADLTDADLSKAVLAYADLSETDLLRADLNEAILEGADLRYAIIWYVDLSGADLRGADLSEAFLKNTDLSGAKYNEQRVFIGFLGIKPTQWPDGFDLAAAGAINVSEQSKPS